MFGDSLQPSGPMRLGMNKGIATLLLSLLAAGGFVLPALADGAPTGNGPESTPTAFMLGLQYNGEAWGNTGGIKAGGNYMHGVDVSLNVDAEKLGWPGARFYASGFYVAGNSLDFTHVGAMEPPSVVDALYANNHVFRFYQAFYEQKIGHTDVLLGFYDLQQQFGATRPAELFLNRGFGLNAPLTYAGWTVGTNGPSIYPNTTLGSRIKQEINDQWTVKVGVLNGMADNPAQPWQNDLIINGQTGILGIAEVDYQPVAGAKFMAGYWGYTSKLTSFELKPDFTRRQMYGTEGGYLGAAMRLFTIEGNRRIDGFVNWGASDSAATVSDRSVNGGLTITGLFADRPEDRLGVAVDAIRVAKPFRDLMAMAGQKFPGQETAFEVTYRARVTDWLAIQPDVQYIRHPAEGSALKDVFVIGVHFELLQQFKF
jgi:porin